ncbi:MAG: FAD:protein FMN transferase [Saprospiraceae bacterium]|nr:FAD:protein FMN transferase [Saprospiraceae bacterium]
MHNDSTYYKPVNSGFFYSLIFALFFTVATACHHSDRPAQSSRYLTIAGETMGTTYHISIDTFLDIKMEIDSLLIDINKAVSTYDPASLISRINSSDEENLVLASNIHFQTNFTNALDVYKATNGLFDPTVMPLVNYWGFGYRKRQVLDYSDQSKIDSIMMLVGMDKWRYSEQEAGFEIRKPAGAELDFSAIAKGYAVDYIADYIEKIGIKNYMVEIGGEVYARGLSKKNKSWAIGLNTPSEDAGFTDYEDIVSIDGKGLASSGNYRNFRITDGIKYGHEINPLTGYSVQTEILGVSVIANNCMIADAYATAFMIMDKSSAMKLCRENPDLDACFFTGNKDGGISADYTEGFYQYLVR